MSGMVNIEIMRGQQDTARGYKWDVLLSGPGPSGTNAINLRCVSTTPPSPDYGDIAVELRAFTKHESGAVQWGEMTFTCIEMISYEIAQGLWDWGQKQFNNKSGVQQLKNSYEGTVHIQLLDLQDSPTKTWLLEGAVLRTNTSPGLDSSKTSMQQPSFTVSYDVATLT